MNPTGPGQLARDELRAARRAFVHAQHPDHGGDAALFIAGLAHFDQTLRDAGPRADLSGVSTTARAGFPQRGRSAAPVLVVRRPRGAQGWVLHVLAAVARLRRPARVL